MFVLDASVWVSLCHADDRHHETTSRWIETELMKGERFAAPTLLRVETAAAVGRLTGKRELAREALAVLDEAHWLELFELTAERSVRAAELAADTRVRAADAVYLQLATELGATLETWDRRQLERGAAAVAVARPSRQNG